MFHSAAIRECTVRNYPARLIYPETAEAPHHALYDPKYYINTKTPKRKREALFSSARSLNPVIFDESRAYTLIIHIPIPAVQFDDVYTQRTIITVPALAFLFTSRESVSHGMGGFDPSFLASICYFPIVCFLSGLGISHTRLATCNLMLMRC